MTIAGFRSSSASASGGGTGTFLASKQTVDSEGLADPSTPAQTDVCCLSMLESLH